VLKGAVAEVVVVEKVAAAAQKAWELATQAIKSSAKAFSRGTPRYLPDAFQPTSEGSGPSEATRSSGGSGS
jgi:hypothetical protein